MEDRPPVAAEWTIQAGDAATIIYYPPVHSRMYVEELAERYPPEIADSILDQADELERRAVALGYPLAEAEHGLDEVGGLERYE